MPWQLHVARQIEKKLARLTAKDQRLILTAIAKLRDDPWNAGLEELKPPLSGFRLRAGNWRVLLALYPTERLIAVTDLQRRTTTTYRKRH